MELRGKNGLFCPLLCRNFWLLLAADKAICIRWTVEVRHTIHKCLFNAHVALLAISLADDIKDVKHVAYNALGDFVLKKNFWGSVGSLCLLKPKILRVIVLCSSSNMP